MFNPPCAKISFEAQVSIRNCVLVCILTFFFQKDNKISKSTLTHVLVYRTLFQRDFRISTKPCIITSRKLRLYYFYWFNPPSSVLSFYKYLYKKWNNIIKRSVSWTTYLCTCLGRIYPLIWVTPLQSYGWTWCYTVTLQLLDLLQKIVPWQNLPRVIFFVSISLISSI